LHGRGDSAEDAAERNGDRYSSPGNFGYSNQEIADQLAITVVTAKWHLHQIFGKLRVRNRTGAAAKGRQLGLL